MYNYCRLSANYTLRTGSPSETGDYDLPYCTYNENGIETLLFAVSQGKDARVAAGRWAQPGSAKPMYLFIRAPLVLVRSTHYRAPVTPGHVHYHTASCASRPLLKRPFTWRACAASSTPEEQKPKKIPRDGTDLTRKPASGTFLGRLAVEVLALMAGVTLLMFVAIWKAATVLALYFWRLLLWLSKVRRLGRWVLSLAVAVARSPRRLGVAVIAAVQNWASAFVAFIQTVTQRRTDDHVVVPAVRVLDDEVTETVSSKELGDMRRELREVREMVERRDSATTSTVSSKASPPAVLVPNTVHRPDEDLAHSRDPTLKDFECMRKTRLILLRHAKSEFDRSGRTADHERALSEGGQREAQLVGAELKRRGWLYNSIVCSNSLRTMQTLDLIDPPSGPVVVTESLYYAVSGDEMATVIDTEASEGLDPGSSKLVVAHNPGICELIERLTGEKPTMGTACAALLEFPREHSDSEEPVSAGSLSARRGEWRLVDIIRPTSKGF